MKPRPDRKLKILVVTLAPPLPPQSGGSRYAVNTMLALSKDFDFHLLTIGDDGADRHIDEHQALYKSVFKTVAVIPRAPLSTLSTLGRALHVAKHWWHKLPFWDASYYESAAVKAAAAIIAEQKIDILEVHSAHLAFFKRFLPEIPAILVYHNIEGDLFPFWLKDGWSKAKLWLVSRFAQVSRANAHAVEIENSYGFQEAIFISKKDMDRVTAPNLGKTYVPLCIPVTAQGRAKALNPAVGEVTDALWLGGFWWYPNADAVQYFCTEIYPLLLDRLATERLVLNFVGANPPASLLELAGPNVKVHGFVEDLDTLLAGMDFMFVPMRLGSGVRVKILEAMANGLPVVSTLKGYEGLNAKDGQHLLSANTPQEFADAMIAMARHPETRKHLATNAIDLVDQDYSQKHYAEVVRGIYERLAAERA